MDDREKLYRLSQYGEGHEYMIRAENFEVSVGSSHQHASRRQGSGATIPDSKKKKKRRNNTNENVQKKGKQASLVYKRTPPKKASPLTQSPSRQK